MFFILLHHPLLKNYQTDVYTKAMVSLIDRYFPEVVLFGATSIGRALAPRIAARIQTGLTADCTELTIDTEKRQLVQTRPAFGGNLMATIVTPNHRPQMATVRPGTFQENPHDYTRTGQVVRIPMPADLPVERLRLVSYEHKPLRGQKIEEARIVVCGGRQENIGQLQNLIFWAGASGMMIGDLLTVKGRDPQVDLDLLDDLGFLLRKL